MSKKYYESSNHREFAGVAKRKQKLPKYYCQTCKQCKNNWCSFYNRHVLIDYNKCFNHSNYSPLSKQFKAIENLEEIIQKEELKRAS